MSAERSRAPWVLYWITVALLAAGTFLPGARIWGPNVWAFVPRALAAGLLVAAMTGPVLVRRAARGGLPGAGRLLPVALGAVAVAFFLLRTHAHFLGDGYQNLGILGADHVRVKATARGTLAVLVPLRDLLGGGEDGARNAYRALAIACGVAYLALVAFAARRLLAGSFERLGFVAILATGGVTAMFYGYVENYAPFVLAVTAHALHGIHVVRTRRTRWAAPALVGAAIWFHVLGFTLIPSLAWVLLAGTPVERSLTRIRPGVRVALVLGIAAAGIAALEAVRHDHLALDLALVPLRPGPFTLGGYTLFSAAHLLDLANLLFLLLPGVGVLLAVAAGAPPAGPVFRFLAVLVTSTSAAVFLLDPKLGMPRDWDVFAFAGVPWMVAGAWAWATASTRRRALRPAGPLAALLGALVLLPRLVVLHGEAHALPLFRAYLALDPARGRNARIHVVNYYRSIGRDDLADEEVRAWNRDYPEREYLSQGVAARNRGDVAGAVEWYLKALAISPQYFDAYNNLADAYLLQQRPDEAVALLKVALAINPGEHGVLTNLGTAEYMRGDFEAARRYWEEALAVNPAGFHPNRNLARLAQQQGDAAGYEHHLGRAAASPEAPGEILAEWGSVLSAHGREEEAREACREALRRGVPDEVAGAVRRHFPDLDGPAGGAP